MQNFAKKTLSVFLAALLLISGLTVLAPTHVHAASFTQAGGWLEIIYAEISGVSASSVTAVSYSGTTSGSLNAQDLKYLVRDESGKVRIDIPGVPAGTYTLSVTAGGTTYTQSGIEVLAHDRSGYAHFNYSEGVGAYNNDGSLKENAIVLYVTDDNKNTVSVTSSDGTTVTGIGNILGSTGMDVGTGLNSKGGVANTNQDILRKLAADGTPLVIRIIGNVKGASSTNMSSATSEIDGLTAYDAIDYGGTVGDNGFMARMSGGKDITIEGIGSGAAIDGWGIHFICQTDDYAKGYGKSFEVRNLSFKNVPEDCIGMEGQQNDGLDAPVERCWIHNCSFYAPTISSPAESDKDGGDGACDFKRGQYMTMDYCVYDGYHKTNLVGASNSNLQFHITWHHNYWKNCDSRGPLGRQANMHIYNCIYEGQTSYAMNPRANCYIFSEYNSFINCKNPVTVDSGAVKSYNDNFTSCIGDNNATIVTDKSTTVSTSCTYANFDTSSTLSYIPSGNYLLDTDYDTMLRNIKAYAGAMPDPIVAPEDVEISSIPSDRIPTAPVALPYSQSLNKTYVAANGTVDNIVFNVAKFNSDSLTVGSSATGYDIVFYVDRTVNISMTEISATYSPVLCAANGQALITGSGSAENVPAGYYYICSSGYDVGSSKYKEAKVASLAIEAVVVHGDNDHVYTEKVTAPTCTKGGYTTYTCDCGASYTGNETKATGHTPGAAATCVDPQTCTVCGDQVAAATGHSYVNGTCSACGAIDPTACAHSDTTVKNAKDATCSAEGYTGDIFCNTCQTTVSTGTAISKLDHTAGAAATCTTAQTCTVCGATVTAALGHNYANGSCTRCGAEDLAASGYIHNFTESGNTSTFYTIAGSLSSSKGTVSYNGLDLTQCLKVSSSASVAFTAPSKGTVTLVFNSSCAGFTIYINGGNSTAIPADGIVTFDVEAGTTYTVTKNKSESFLYYIVYAPEGSSSGGDVHTHSYAESITTAATCTTDGVKTFACSCGDSYTEAIPATGHSYTAKVTAPTCTVQGYTTYTCSCGDSYVDDFVAATGHSHEAVVTAPTCTAQGYTTYTCACGDSYVDNYVAETGHDYSSDLQAPTCTETGLRTYTCGNCGHSYTETVAALGHSYSDGKCTVCGAADPDAETPDETIKNGLVKGEDGNYYYYIDNVLQSDYTGLVANSAGRWYILNGQAQLSYDGLITFEGTKYLIKAGHVNTAFTGITKQEGVYYYFAAGVNDLEFEGLVYCNGMKAYVQDGEVNFNKTGVVEDEGNLVYVKYGIWRNTFKGLARTDDGQWIYMVNGTFDATYTGVAKLNANWVYVENGYVSSTYSGTVTVNGVDYTVKYGVVQF